MNNKKLSIRVLFPLIMSISIVFCILSCMILFSHYISTYLVRKTIEETSRQKNVLAQNIENEIDSINSIMNNIYYNTIKKYDIQDKNFKTILANEITSNSETIYGLALYDTDGKNLWHSNNLTSTSMQNESWFTQAKDNIETICYGSKKLVYPDNVKQVFQILFTLIIILISTITIWKLPQTQNGYTHIGIAVYDMDDTFINDYVTKLQNKIDRSSFSGKKILYEIFDAEGNANRQEHQLQYMYTQNFDALLINLVTPSSAASVLNETANHDIPVILFNREADKKDLSISKQTWYVGTAAKKAGAIQADMLQNVWNTDKINLDRNKNNKLDYILIEGEQTHFDAVRRTNGFLENSQNLPLNQLTNLSADWQRNLASVKFSKLDTSIIQSAEAIICNNDDMALGVYDYYKQHNLKLPLILGINNSPEMNQKIQAGEIYGTVDNGTNDQISYVCKLLNDILNKDTAKYHKIWYSKPFAIEK